MTQNFAPAAPNSPRIMLDEKAQHDLQKANKLREKGEFAKCEKILKRVLKKYPTHVPALNILVIAQVNQGKNELGLQALAKILEQEPQNITALRSNALVAMETRNIGHIEAAFTKAFEHITNDAVLYQTYAVGLSQNGRESEAMQYYKKAIENDPNLDQVQQSLLDLAAILFKNREFQSALDVWFAYLSKQPKDDKIMIFVSDTLFRMGKKEEALDFAIQALAHSPDNPRSHMVFLQTLKLMPISEFDEKIFQSLYYILSVGQVELYSVFQQWYGLLVRNKDFSQIVAAIQDLDTIETALDNPDFVAQITHPYVLLGLRYILPNEANFEFFLTTLRRVLLEKMIAAEKNENAGDMTAILPFICAMAETSFMNEYVWVVSTSELENLKALKQMIDLADLEKDGVEMLQKIMMLATYEPLHELEKTQHIIAYVDGLQDEALKIPVKAHAQNVVALQITEPQAEAKIKAGLTSLETINDDVSQKVQAQYEENPYPRWRTNYVKDQEEFALSRDQKDILVAGCGTGRHVTIAYMKYPNAKITALDLSRSSLAYAKRKITEMDLGAVDFVHGDILNVDKMGKTFDHIECSGVLHHMQTPIEGWEKLVALLRSNGTMRIGLYSEIARQDVVAMRAEIKAKGFDSDISGIRAARMHVFGAEGKSALKTLLISRDFYATSSCRDLIMHVQEHRYTIERLQQELDQLGLSFEGMCLNAAPRLAEYQAQHPEDLAIKDLQKIAAFERANPSTFRGMYQFDVRKKS